MVPAATQHSWRDRTFASPPTGQIYTDHLPHSHDPTGLRTKRSLVASDAVSAIAAARVDQHRAVIGFDQPEGCVVAEVLHTALALVAHDGPDTVLAEASAFSETYHCDAVVTESATIASLPKTTFIAALRDDPDLALAWSAMLARSVQAARVRAEIRSLPKVAERLEAWLDEGHTLPEKGRWQDVAAELGVTREALYRELSRRRVKERNS